MRYHSNIKTILITLLVASLFFVSSVFLLMKLNLTSPTLIVTNRILSSLSEAESDVSFYFSGMERNFRDRVMINDFNLYYKGDNIASFDTVEVKLGLFDIIKYFLNLEGGAEIIFKNGSLSFDSSYFMDSSGHSSSISSDFDLSDILSEHNLMLTFDDIAITSDIATGYIDNLTLSYSGRNKVLLGEVNASSLRIDYSPLSVNFDGFGLQFKYGETIFLKGDISKTEVLYSGINGLVDDISLSMTTSDLDRVMEGELTLKLTTGKVNLNDGDNNITLGSTVTLVDGARIDSSLSSLLVSAMGINASTGEVSLSLLNYDEYSVNIPELDINLDDTSLKVSGITLDGFIENKKLSYNASSLSSDITSLTGSLFSSLDITRIKGDVDYNNGILLSLCLRSRIGTVSDRLDDISFNLDSSLDIVDGKINDSNILINELYLGYGEKHNSSLTIKGDLDKAYVTFDYGSFDIDFLLSLESRTLSGSFLINDYPIIGIKKLLGADDITFFDDDSLFNFSSYLNLSLDDEMKIGGNIDYYLGLNSFKISKVETGLSSKGKLNIESELIKLIGVNISTSFFDFLIDGYYDLEKRLPSIDFTSTLNSGGPLMDGYIHLGEGRSYNFFVDIKAVENTTIKGLVDFNSDDIVSSSPILFTNGKERPFDLLINTKEKTVSLKSSNLDFSLDYSLGMKGSISAQKLETMRSNDNNPIVLNGALDFAFSLENGFTLASTPITIENIFLVPTSPSISFKINGNNDLVKIDDIKLSNVNSSYSGLFECDFVSNELLLSLKEDTGEGRIVLSLYKEDEYIAALKAEKLSLSLIGDGDMKADVTLFGRAEEIENFAFNGNVSIESENNDGRMIKADLSLNSERINFENIVYSSPDVTASLSSLYFDSITGKYGIEDVKLYLPIENADGKHPIEAKFSLSGGMEKESSLSSSISKIIENKGEGLKTTLILDYIDIDSSLFLIKDKYFDISLVDNSFVLDGNFLSGNFSLSEKRGTISIALENICVASFTVDLNDDLSLYASVDEFNMELVNIFFYYPVLLFRDDIVSGEATLTRVNGEFTLNGSLSAPELGCSVFWMEDQSLILHNPRFTIWDNELKSSFTYATVLDNLTGKRKIVSIEVGVTLAPSLSLERWDVDVYMDKDNPVRVRLPISLANIDILGYVYGHYKAGSDNFYMTNDGEIYLSNTTVSIGMNDYPLWYDEMTGLTLLDMKFNFLNNNEIIYPAGDDPIFSVILQENSSMDVTFGESTISCVGDVQIRGGEIYYFQKYFYITSGSITFDDPTQFNPKISLRATLRDYDSSSERVEIYLVMKNNTFDNLSPTLESSPQKDLSEIMEILGQSILPQSAYGSVSVSSVASIVTESFDILSRLGIVTTTSNPLSSLSSSLKSVFGVDTFSLHSNILNNIVTDTISQAMNTSVNTYSPMARFLNGTTLNIGKYLSQNLYMQIMVHLQAEKNKESYTIISDDLALDTEFSLEWVNDAFNLTFFTRPNYFSFYSILSTFGFTITKTINF